MAVNNASYMLTALSSYLHCGKVFFSEQMELKVETMRVPQEPGIYLIYINEVKLENLVYIGKSGTIKNDGTWKGQTLRGRLNNKQEGVKRQEYFVKRMREENIESLHIHWFVTYNEQVQHLPVYAEALLMQEYYDLFKRLPPWHKEF